MILCRYHRPPHTSPCSKCNPKRRIHLRHPYLHFLVLGRHYHATNSNANSKPATAESTKSHSYFLNECVLRFFTLPNALHQLILSCGSLSSLCAATATHVFFLILVIFILWHRSPGLRATTCIYACQSPTIQRVRRSVLVSI